MTHPTVLKMGALELADTFNLVTTDDADRCLEALDQLSWLKQETTRIKRELEERIVLWLKEHGHESARDTFHGHYLSKPPKYMPKKTKVEIFETLFIAAGGDIEKLVATFTGTNPFKIGEVKALLGNEGAAQLYETTWPDKRELSKAWREPAETKEISSG